MTRGRRSIETGLTINVPLSMTPSQRDRLDAFAKYLSNTRSGAFRAIQENPLLYHQWLETVHKPAQLPEPA